MSEFTSNLPDEDTYNITDCGNSKQDLSEYEIITYKSKFTSKPEPSESAALNPSTQLLNSNIHITQQHTTTQSRNVRNANTTQPPPASPSTSKKWVSKRSQKKLLNNNTKHATTPLNADTPTANIEESAQFNYEPKMYNISMNDINHTVLSAKLIELINNWQCSGPTLTDMNVLIYDPNVLQKLYNIVQTQIIKLSNTYITQADLYELHNLKQLSNLILYCNTNRTTQDALVIPDSEFIIFDNDYNKNDHIMKMRVLRRSTMSQFISPEKYIDKLYSLFGHFYAAPLKSNKSVKLHANIRNIPELTICIKKEKEDGKYKLQNIEVEPSANDHFNDVWCLNLYKILKQEDFYDIISGTLFHLLDNNRTCCNGLTHTRLSKVSVILEAEYKSSIVPPRVVYVCDEFKNIATIYAYIVKCYYMHDWPSEYNNDIQIGKIIKKSLKLDDSSNNMFNRIIKLYPVVLTVVEKYKLQTNVYKSNQKIKVYLTIYIESSFNGEFKIDKISAKYHK